MEVEELFEDFWDDVVAYAKEVGITTEYAEEEFIIEGEFQPVHLIFSDL